MSTTAALGRDGLGTRLARWFHDRPGFHVTRTGVMVGAMVTTLGVAAINNDANLMLLLFGAGTGTLVVAACMTATALKPLHTARTMPAAAMAGCPFRIRYRLENRHRWRRLFALDLMDRIPNDRVERWPRAYIPMIPPRATVSVDVTVRATRRGRLVLDDLRIGTRYPMALFSRRSQWNRKHEVLVYPAPGRLRRPVWQAGAACDVNRERSSNAVGGTEEFVGLRDYRHGDNPRWIHWRRSARTGKLVVREMAQSRPGAGLIVLDAQPRAGAGEAERETAIRLAATLCDNGLEQGFRIGLIASGQPLAVVPLAGGRRQGTTLLRELALMDADDGDFLAALERLPWSAEWTQAMCVVVAVADDEQTHRLVDRLRQRNRNRNVQTLIVGTPDFDAVFDASTDAELTMTRS